MLNKDLFGGFLLWIFALFSLMPGLNEVALVFFGVGAVFLMRYVHQLSNKSEADKRLKTETMPEPKDHVDYHEMLIKRAVYSENKKYCVIYIQDGWDGMVNNLDLITMMEDKGWEYVQAIVDAYKGYDDGPLVEFLFRRKSQ